ncbi:SRPBCC domain-containing protein [bacterium]|nr:SRPBCC domain-containing protein [bacterium]
MNELHLTRIYKAPRNLVWEVWTDPKHVAQWWGPRGFTLTHHDKQLKVGGRWNYTMHGPDGVDYPNSTLYHEVVEGERLVYDHGSDGQSKPLFRVTVTFRDVPDGTRMDMTMTFESAEAARASEAFIRKAGGLATWDRLAEYLEKQTQGSESFVIQRYFAAPRELVFSMWTQPAHLACWLPPAGARMEYLEVDIRPGGSAFYRMDHPGGALYGRVEYHEILAPERLVYSQMFSDEQKGRGKHPMLPVFPERMHTTVVFLPEREGTRISLTWRPEGEVNASEMEAFLRTRDSMTPGWNGSFDKLEALLHEQTGAFK